ncbi:MAG: DNA polymerase [Armatimonadota bacterium]|nr:MAG: DNA polymerase [Armatimonadota bacterium]
MTDEELEQVIFGADSTEGIVAVGSDAEEVSVYHRTEKGLAVERAELRPWLVSDQKSDLPGAEWTSLAGEGYAFLAEFAQWSDFLDGRQRLVEGGVDHLAYGDRVRQYLTRSGRTLFKGMNLNDLRRLQLDIETIGLSPEEPEARIILVALADSTGWHELLEGEEADILLRLSELIRARDPDVIEGHNIFGFDLPYLSSRAEKCGALLDWGRDGSALRFGRRRRCAMGGRSRPFIPAYVSGRHVIDTMLALQRFDAQSAKLESYGLKAAAEQLGLAELDREQVDQTNMEREWASDPDRVRKYALQDIIETGRLAAHVMPTDFYLTQMVPDLYQTVAVSGTGEKINALLVREYLRRGVALARPQSPRRFPGGYVEVRRRGVISPIVKVDVESLYPSIMLSEGIAPATDTLGIFLPVLGELTRRRLEAKGRAREASGSERGRWEGIQSSFKVLINSFYGYLGSGFLFNDYEAAGQVTRRGQELVREIADRVEQTGGQVVEIDTDGVYLRPPDHVRDERAELAYVEEIGAALPKGIKLQHDGRYRAMVSLKVKNYICVGYDGRKVFRGASVRSRADEPFGREFLAEGVDLMLEGDLAALADRYRQLSDQVLAGGVPIQKLARRERVTEKTFSSPAKRRSAAVAQGTPIGDYISVYQKADGSLGLLQDYAGDEDRVHYAEKLYRFAVRLREAVGPRFEELFPYPSVRAARQASAGQTNFDFD